MCVCVCVCACVCMGVCTFCVYGCVYTIQGVYTSHPGVHTLFGDRSSLLSMKGVGKGLGCLFRKDLACVLRKRLGCVFRKSLACVCARVCACVRVHLVRRSTKAQMEQECVLYKCVLSISVCRYTLFEARSSLLSMRALNSSCAL